MLMFAEVVQVTVYFVRVVVRAAEPVPVQSSVPEALFSLTVAWANIVPRFAVFFIHKVNVTVEPLGTTPVRFGSPD